MVDCPPDRLSRRPELAGLQSAGDPDRPGGRYVLALLCLVTSYLVTAMAPGQAGSVVGALLYTLTLMLVLRTSRLRAHALWVRLTLVLGSAIAVGLLLVDNDTASGVAALWFILVLGTAIVVVVQRILTDPVVTIQTIFGAVSAYIMIGLMYAAAYSAISHFGSNPFFVNEEPVTVSTLQYFSFVTMTTLGYGDFTAAANGARAVASLEALTGQIFLATLVARLVASFVPRGRPPWTGEDQTS